MSCPKCNGEQLCPCKNCADDNAGKVVWKWLDDGENISCGHCGHTMHVDAWLDALRKALASLPDAWKL